MPTDDAWAEPFRTASFKGQDVHRRLRFGELVRALRLETLVEKQIKNGTKSKMVTLSQALLASKIEKAGEVVLGQFHLWTDRDVRRLEEGEMPIRPELIYILAKALETDTLDTGLLWEVAGMHGAQLVVVDLLKEPDHPIHRDALAMPPFKPDIVQAVVGYFPEQSVELDADTSVSLYQEGLSLGATRAIFRAIVSAMLIEVEHARKSSSLIGSRNRRPSLHPSSIAETRVKSISTDPL